MTKVLIVEDHISMRESLTAALTASGEFEIIGEVSNADYALDFCKRLHPDMILMDVCTEGGASGLKAVEAIRKNDTEIKIIVMPLTKLHIFRGQRLLAPMALFIKAKV